MDCGSRSQRCGRPLLWWPRNATWVPGGGRTLCGVLFPTLVFLALPTGLHANELAHQVMQHRDSTQMHHRRILVLDEGGSQYGIRTADPKNILTSKESLRNMAAAVIDAKKLRFLSTMVCVCDTERIDAERCTERLVRQLEVYGADVLPPLRVGDRPRRKWHGKRGSGHDDLAMALQLNLLANRLCLAQPNKYGLQ